MRAAAKVTIYDVAERAGVSISTVSLAINAPHRVSESTRARVVAAAGSLGYRAAAGGRRSPGGLRITVAAPFRTYSTYFRRFAGMLVRARETEIELTVHDLESAASVTSPLLDDEFQEGCPLLAHADDGRRLAQTREDLLDDCSALVENETGNDGPRGE